VAWTREDEREKRKLISEKRRKKGATSKDSLLEMTNRVNQKEHLVMAGVSGKLEWINHVGYLEGKPLYQASHFWMYGKLMRNK
jgi:hypothetical protein